MPDHDGSLTTTIAIAASVALILYWQERRLRRIEASHAKAASKELNSKQEALKEQREEMKAEVKSAAASVRDGVASRGDVLLRLNRLLLKDDPVDQVHRLADARDYLREVQQALTNAQHWLDQEQPENPPTSRAGYLASLRELIGPPPIDRTWYEEWEKMTKEWLTSRKDHWEAAQELQKESLAVLREKRGYKAEIEELHTKMGWTKEHAEAWVMLSLRRDVISKALSQRREDYAASTYAICEALAAAAAASARAASEGADVDDDSRREEEGEEEEAGSSEQSSEQVRTPRTPSPPRFHRELRRQSSGFQAEESPGNRHIPGPLYRHLRGKHSLAASDSKWEDIYTHDCNGFRGLTSCALTRATFGPDVFTERGFREVKLDPDTQKFASFDAHDSPVVRFDSKVDDDTGSHSAILFSVDKEKRTVKGAW